MSEQANVPCYSSCLFPDNYNAAHSMPQQDIARTGSCAETHNV